MNRDHQVPMLKRSLIAAFPAALLLSGCAAGTVLSRPNAKNMNVLNTGSNRGAVLSELGTPNYTKETNGERLDTFAFDKGVKAGYKFGRGFMHIGADIFTVFLWEIVAWPAEKVAAHPNTLVEVSYDKDEKVSSVKFLKGHARRSGEKALTTAGEFHRERG